MFWQLLATKCFYCFFTSSSRKLEDNILKSVVEVGKLMGNYTINT